MARRRVYVVDDEEPIRRAASLLLRVSGFDSTTFESGQAFLQVADALVPGCVLLDMRMPGMDGLELQQALNTASSVHPVVFMTGHGDLHAAVSALQGGAVAFIEKPFSKAQLLDGLELAFLKLEAPETFSRRVDIAAGRMARLRADEHSLLSGIADGRSKEEIGQALGLTPLRFETLRARAVEQLGVESLSAALTITISARLRPPR